MKLPTIVAFAVALLVGPSLATANGQKTAEPSAKSEPCATRVAGAACGDVKPAADTSAQTTPAQSKRAQAKPSRDGSSHQKRPRKTSAQPSGPETSPQNKSSAIVTVERGVRVWRMIVPQQQTAHAPAQSGGVSYDDTRSNAGYSGTNGYTGYTGAGSFVGGGTIGGAVPSFGFGTGSGLGGIGAQPSGQASAAPNFGAPLRANRLSVGDIAPRRAAKLVVVRGGFDRPRFTPGFGPRYGGRHNVVIRGNFGPKMGIGGPRIGAPPIGGRRLTGKSNMLGPRIGSPRLMGMGPRMGGPRMGGPRMIGGRRGGGMR